MTNPIEKVALRTGRYNFVDNNYEVAKTGLGTTIGQGVNIKQAPISQYEWNLRNLPSYSTENQRGRLEREAEDRDREIVARKKRDMLGQLQAAKVKQDRINQLEANSLAVGDISRARIQEMNERNRNIEKQFNDVVNAIKSVNTLEGINNFKIANPDGSVLSFQQYLNEYNPSSASQAITTTPVVAPTPGTPSAAPQEGRKTSRVLSTIRGGKRVMAAPQVKPVEIKRSPEDEKMIQDFATNSGISREEAIKVIDNPRFKEFIAAGYTPEEARVNTYSSPTGDIIQKEHTGLSGTFETAKAQKEGQPPVQITDEATLAAIEAAKTPEEKQAIIDKWNMEKTQEAADKNIQFKKEADTNSDGVIDAKEAGKFQEAHAAATFNEAAKVDPSWMDPGRQKLLDEIARGTKVIGKDVQTVLDKNEEKYIQGVKQQDISDSYISKINVHINAWNTATTNEQRRAAKNQIKLISDQLKESNPDAWSTMQKTIQPQIAKIETGIKEGKKKREDEKNLNEQKKIFIDSQIKSGVSKEAAERAWGGFAEAGNLPGYTPPVVTPPAPTAPVPPPAAATNAGGATRIDMIQNGNNINRIDQGRPQQIGTQENPIKPN